MGVAVREETLKLACNLGVPSRLLASSVAARELTSLGVGHESGHSSISGWQQDSTRLVSASRQKASFIWALGVAWHRPATSRLLRNGPGASGWFLWPCHLQPWD